MKTYKIISAFFLTILLASCSKDDEASNSFFNKYDGIAWEDNDAIASGIIFKKSPQSLSFFYEDFEDNLQCDELLVFGVEDEDGYIFNIIQENEDSVVFEETFTNIDGSIETSSFTCRVINNGSTLELTLNEPTQEVETYTRLATSPCN